MRDDFGSELTRVSDSLVTMAKVVREAMRQASVALLEADHNLAGQVLLRHRELGVLHRIADDRVVDLIERHQPVAGELRAALTSLQASADLARMGALAKNVARATLRRHPEPAVVPELAGLFREMGTVADQLAGKIVSALAYRDGELAARLDGDDDAMDRLHLRLFAALLNREWPLGAEAAVDGALLGRYYERYADHAVSVGRYVLFLAGVSA